MYPNCKKFSKLEYLIKPLHDKIIFGWSQKSFDFILNLIKEAYSKEKKYIHELGLHQYMHVRMIMHYFIKSINTWIVVQNMVSQGMLKIPKEVRSGLTRF